MKTFIVNLASFSNKTICISMSLKVESELKKAFLINISRIITKKFLSGLKKGNE